MASINDMVDDASVREVFRGDLSEAELAGGLLEEHGISFQRRWVQAGGAEFTIGETALLPGRAVVLLVPSIAYEEARDVLAVFESPEPDVLTDFSTEVAASRQRRKRIMKIVAAVCLAPIAIWAVVVIVALIVTLFR